MRLEFLPTFLLKVSPKLPQFSFKNSKSFSFWGGCELLRGHIPLSLPLCECWSNRCPPIFTRLDHNYSLRSTLNTYFSVQYNKIFSWCFIPKIARQMAPFRVKFCKHFQLLRGNIPSDTPCVALTCNALIVNLAISEVYESDVPVPAGFQK